MTKSDENVRKLENQAPHLSYYPHWLDNLAEDAPLGTNNPSLEAGPRR